MDFQFIGNGFNTVTITNFNFGGGSASNDPARLGSIGAGNSGDLSSSLTLTTGEFFNEYFQGFTAGSSLSFDVYTSDPVINATPDAFSFSILDNQLFNIPTDFGPGNVLMFMEFNAAEPSAQTFTAANGVSVHVPDSGATFGLLGLALLSLAALHQSSRLRSLFVA